MQLTTSQLRQIFSIAAAGYYDVLFFLAATLHRYGPALGLMIPGFPEQLGINSGIDVTDNGVPLYYAVVKRCGETNRPPMAFGKALQEALDATSYQNCVNRIVLLQVKPLPGGYVGLTLTVEA